MNLEEMVIKLRAGDKTVTDDIIKHHIPLVGLIAKNLSFNNLDYTDNRSAGFLGLVHGVQLAKDKLYDNDITPFLVVKIRSQIWAFKRDNNLIRIPPYKLKELKYYYHEIRNDLLGYYEPDSLFIEEALIVLALSPQHNKVILMCLEGYTTREIADKLSLSKGDLNRIMTRIRYRYNECAEEHNWLRRPNCDKARSGKNSINNVEKGTLSRHL